MVVIRMKNFVFVTLINGGTESSIGGFFLVDKNGKILMEKMRIEVRESGRVTRLEAVLKYRKFLKKKGLEWKLKIDRRKNQNNSGGKWGKAHRFESGEKAIIRIVF